VLDIAQAHIKALESLEAHQTSGVFNIGSQHGFSVLEVIQACEAVTGKKVNYSIQPRRPGDPPRLVASSQNIREGLGWIPEYSDLTTMISSAWAWQQKLVTTSKT
jgi:UDP-glucose 4-epimerase